MSDNYLRIKEANQRLLKASSSAGESTTLPVGPPHALSSARLSRGPAGELQILIDLPAGRAPHSVNVGQVLRADWVELASEESAHSSLGTALMLTCADQRLHPTLISLIGEMVDRAEKTGRPCIDELNDALASWRAILAEAASSSRRGPLIGVFGEIVILQRMARLDPMAALDAWKGPDGAPHDFQRRNAVEVKTFSSTGAPVVTIHGPTQLDPPQGGSLHLAALRVEEGEDGQTLDELIDATAALGIPRQTLLKRAREAEVPLEGKRLVVSTIRLFRVDEEFPGIRESTMTFQQKLGIENLQYSLQLDACPGEMDSEQLDAVLQGL